MKFTSIFVAVVLSAVAVSALPCSHSDHHPSDGDNFEDNSNTEVRYNKEKNTHIEDNHVNNEKHVTQVAENIGSSGSNKKSGGGGGLLGGLLGLGDGGLVNVNALSPSTQTTNFKQEAHIH